MLTRYWPLILIVLTLLLLTSVPVWAQAPPGAVADATMQVSGVYRKMKALGNSVAMICALIGFVKVYNRVQMADPDVYRAIFAWVFAILFCLFFPYVVDVLFR